MAFKMILFSKQKRKYINLRTVSDCFSSIRGVLLLFVCSASAQADPLIKIADDVVSQTVFGEPSEIDSPNPTRYNLWMYQNFMIMEGMDALGEVTGDECYRNYTKRSIDFFAAFQSSLAIDESWSGRKRAMVYKAPSNVAMWNDCRICRAPQIETESRVYSGDENFDRLLEKTPRFDDGVLVRDKSKNRGLGLQIDDLYMIAPYWCRKAMLLEDSKWLDRAINESLHYFDYLWDTEDKLMNPLWMQKRKGPYGLYWGRGNGWYIMAITDLLTFIPQDHPKRKEVLNDYRSFIKGIVLRQGKEGLWYQILDKPDSYQETSCSGMFTYCILKGINEGWLDDSYFPAAKKGWYGLLSVVNENNELTGVCPPSDISEDPNYYLKGRAPRVHDQHGIGPFLLAGAAYLQANKKLKK